MSEALLVPIRCSICAQHDCGYCSVWDCAPILSCENWEPRLSFCARLAQEIEQCLEQIASVATLETLQATAEPRERIRELCRELRETPEVRP